MRRPNFLALAATTALLSACAEGPSIDAEAEAELRAAPDRTRVETAEGPVQGVREGDVLVWRGIPFAAPPVGVRRWRRPEPPGPRTGVLDASRFRPFCAQGRSPDSVIGDEDCLYLNIYRPASHRGRLPVLFWMHGGGNTAGKGQTEAHALALRGAVVVTMEYRLSNLGFMGLRALADEATALYGAPTTGNYAYLDMLAALGWVKTNIGGFGGDRGRVTAFGESAGGSDIGRLLASPLSHGLVDGAILESGEGVITLQNTSTVAESESAGEGLAAALGCSNPDGAAELACLRAAPFSAIQGNGFFFGATVVLDGHTYDQLPLDVYRDNGVRIPLMLVSNRQDAIAAIFFPFPMTEDQYVQQVQSDFGDLAAQLLALYPASAYPTPFDAYVDLTSDAIFFCPNRTLAQIVTGGGNRDVFWGLYAHRMENDPDLAALGAFHGQDVAFVFGSFADVLGVDYTPTAAEQQFSSDLGGYWTRFAAGGEPNGDHAVRWPRFKDRTRKLLQLDETFAPIRAYKDQACDLLSGL